MSVESLHSPSENMFFLDANCYLCYFILFEIACISSSQSCSMTVAFAKPQGASALLSSVHQHYLYTCLVDITLG